MSHKAWQNAHAMYENDACAKALGIDIISMDEGFAVVTMTVSAQMLNGHQSCHGGQLFSLADTAFAYACNSQGGAAVASACTKSSPNPSPSSKAARLPSQISPPRWERESPYREEIKDVPLTGTAFTACWIKVTSLLIRFSLLLLL